MKKAYLFGLFGLFIVGCTNFDYRAHKLKCSTEKPCVSGFKCANGFCVPQDMDVITDTRDAVANDKIQKDVHHDKAMDVKDLSDANKCGNGHCDSDENCETCPKDCGCTDGTVCRGGNCVSPAEDVIEDVKDIQVDDGTQGKDITDMAEDVTVDEGHSGPFCGNGVCETGENCENCTNDCGCSDGMVCRDRSCVAPARDIIADVRDIPVDEDVPDIAEDVTTDEGYAPQCGNGVCEPGENCENCVKDCGCEEGKVCYNSECCTPQTCENLHLECGKHSDHCGGFVDCGGCPEHYQCWNDEGHCHCQADCGDKECGDDGCGGSCGTCGGLNQVCNDGKCICEGVSCNGGCCKTGDVCYNSNCCTPRDCEWLGFECGKHSDHCGGTVNCGECTKYPNSQCGGDGKCTCVPSCDGRECGDNGCGGNCGDCRPPLTCSKFGTCVCPQSNLCGSDCCNSGDYCYENTCNTPTSPVVETGQNTCVSSSETIPCPGKPGSDECSSLGYCGQDAQYKSRERTWIPEGLEGEKVVKDSLTGIEYQVTYGKVRDYQHAAAYCEGLKYGGYTDWILPTLSELLNTINYGKTSPAVDKDVFDMPSSGMVMFWSRDEVYGTTEQHWAMFAVDGTTMSHSDGEQFYVRCVRKKEVKPPVERFIKIKEDSGVLAILDKETGLVWNAKVEKELSWRQALAYCESLNCCDYKDWHLANINELRSLVDLSTKYPATGFPDFTTGTYWSSTHSGPGTLILKVDFSTGQLSLTTQDSVNMAICVRSMNFIK